MDGCIGIWALSGLFVDLTELGVPSWTYRVGRLEESDEMREGRALFFFFSSFRTATGHSGREKGTAACWRC